MKRLLLLALLVAPVAFADDGPRITGVLGAKEPPEAIEVRGLFLLRDGHDALVVTRRSVIRVDLGRLVDPVRVLSIEGDIGTAAISSDEKTLLVTTRVSEQLQLVDLGSGRCLKSRLWGGVLAAADLSMDMRSTALLRPEGSCALYDLEQGTLLAGTELNRPILGGGFTDDGATIFMVIDGSIQLYDPAEHAVVGSITVTRNARTVAMSADGQRLAVSDGRRVIRYDRQGKELGERAQEEPYARIALSRDGEHVLGATTSGRLYFDGRPPVSSVVPDTHTLPVRGLAVSADQLLVASTGADGTVLLWDAARGENARHLQVGRPLGPVAFSPRDGTLLVATRGPLELLDVTRNLVVRRFEGLEGSAAVGFLDSGSVVWASDGERHATWPLEGGAATIVDGAVPLEGQRTLVLPEKVHAIALAPDGRRALMAGEELALWDLDGVQRIRVYENCPASDGPLAFSLDGSTLAVFHTDHNLRFWTPSTTWAHGALDFAREGEVTALAFGKDRLFVGLSDGRILEVAGGGR